VPVRKVEWREPARSDLLSIVDYVSDDNPDAAQRLKDEIEAKESGLPERVGLYRPGRVFGTREMVVRANYVVVYAVDDRTVGILRVLHAAQQWPPSDGDG
jgi:addiction module RelE/StbE family toxin